MSTQTQKTNIKPKQLTKKLLSVLKDRSLDVIESRYGIGRDTHRKTLEAIGKKYNITRERVRQIENAAISSIRKSEEYKRERAAFDEIKNVIKENGSLLAEDELLGMLGKDDETQNHFHFYLVLGDAFTKHKEDDHFKARWSVDNEVTEKIHGALEHLYSNMSDDELLSEKELISRFLDEVKDISNEYRQEEIIRRWLCVSKGICKNPLGEWGKSGSQNVKTRGIRDYAFLIMRKHGSPMHFREVAKAIAETFGRKAHIATCHNELIKDSRFVLVGRGMYALAEWGYKEGVVRDVIQEILKKEGPLSRDAIIDKVLKERYLKKNTILVNLQNPKYFKKTKEGLYTIA